MQATLVLISMSHILIPTSAVLEHSFKEINSPQNILSAEYEKESTVEIKIGVPFTGPKGVARLTTYTDCGGVINARYDVTDAIEYKYSGNYSSNELCIWTIINTDGASLVFYKYPSELDPKYDFVQITTFEKDRYYEPYQTVILSRTTAPEEVTMTAPLAVVVFSTDGSKQRRGFRLMVNTIGSPSYNYTYRDLSSDSLTGNLTLQPYFNNMMSTFVVSPKSEKWVKIKYDTESCCDRISVFHLQRSWTSSGFKMTFAFTERNYGLGQQVYNLYVGDSSFKYSALFFIFTSNDSILGNYINIIWTK